MGSFDFNGGNIHSTKYADDVTIVECVSRNQTSSMSMTDCVALFRDNGLSLNQNKCKQLCFRRSRDVHVNFDTGFVRTNVVRVLGVLFEDNFKWRAQICHVLKLASQRLHIIRSLKGFLTHHELIQVFNSIITSVFLYASPAYGQLPLTLMARLKRFMRRGHRMICGPSCDCEAFPDLQEKFEEAAVRLLASAEGNSEHALHSLVPGRLPASGQLRLPVVSTTRRNNSFFPWASRVLNSLT
jgi:hypothetical protein